MGSFTRGKAHSACNLALQTPQFISFFYHCGSSYDFHLIIMKFAERKFKLKCLPKTKENYISFSVYIPIFGHPPIELRFLDSYRFLPESIAALTDGLSTCPKYIEFHQTNFPNSDWWSNPQKQFLPYDYYNSFEKLNETEFPSIEKFFSPLRNSNISQEDYNHALNVFNSLQDRTLGGYLDYYLTIDTLLLHDIMKEFRETSIKNFHLDPVFSYTTAGFSFQCALFHIKNPINLVTDLNIIQLINKNIRGGISCAMTRYSKSNNKYMKEGYKKEEGPPVQNMYIDCNGLYTYTMTNYKLPEGEYQTLKGSEFDDVKKKYFKYRSQWRIWLHRCCRYWIPRTTSHRP